MKSILVIFMVLLSYWLFKREPDTLIGQAEMIEECQDENTIVSNDINDRMPREDQPENVVSSRWRLH